MRIILLLAAAGAAAIGTAAAARPGGGQAAPGPGSGWSVVAPGHHGARAGWQAYSRPATGRDHRRRGRRGGQRPVFYDGFGIAGPSGLVEPWGDGFFAGGGGAVRMRGSRPHYDYDRSYPYEWAPSGRAIEQWEEESAIQPPPPRCTLEHGVRVCRGG